MTFRQLDYENQYKKWQWIEVDITKNISDFRPESHRPVDIDKSFNVGETIEPTDNWNARRQIALNKVYTNMTELILDAKNDAIGTSLAVVKPSQVTNFIWEDCDRE